MLKKSKKDLSASIVISKIYKKKFIKNVLF